MVFRVSPVAFMRLVRITYQGNQIPSGKYPFGNLPEGSRNRPRGVLSGAPKGLPLGVIKYPGRDPFRGSLVSNTLPSGEGDPLQGSPGRPLKGPTGIYYPANTEKGRPTMCPRVRVCRSPLRGGSKQAPQIAAQRSEARLWPHLSWETCFVAQRGPQGPKRGLPEPRHSKQSNLSVGLLPDGTTVPQAAQGPRNETGAKCGRNAFARIVYGLLDRLNIRMGRRNISYIRMLN